MKYYAYAYNFLAASTLFIALTSSRHIAVAIATCLMAITLTSSTFKHLEINKGYRFQDAWMRYAALGFICMTLGESRLALVWYIVAMIKASVTLRSE